MSEQETKKKKSLMKKIGSKFKKETADELMIETLGELKDIVSSMRGVFDQFEEGYEEQLEEDRTAWQKFQSKLPGFLQSEHTRVEMRRVDKIKTNKESLSELEDNFNKLELVLTSSQSTIESISEAFVNSAIPGEKNSDALGQLEEKMNEMQLSTAHALGDINMQISLIKSALDNMAGQLDEQGVVLGGIDGKIDVLDTKMDKAEALLKKISKQITGNRLIILAIAATATAVIAQKFLVN